MAVSLWTLPFQSLQFSSGIKSEQILNSAILTLSRASVSVAINKGESLSPKVSESSYSSVDQTRHLQRLVAPTQEFPAARFSLSPQVDESKFTLTCRIFHQKLNDYRSLIKIVRESKSLEFKDHETLIVDLTKSIDEACEIFSMFAKLKESSFNLNDLEDLEYDAQLAVDRLFVDLAVEKEFLLRPFVHIPSENIEAIQKLNASIIKLHELYPTNEIKALMSSE